MSIIDNILRNAGGKGVNVKSTTAIATIRRNKIKDTAQAIHRSYHGASTAISNAIRGSTTVQGTLSGLASETLILDFYAYPPLSTAPETDLYIGTATVQLDSGGFGSYHEIFPTTAPTGWRITSTVTNDTEGTSELSAALTIAPPSDTDGDGLPNVWEALYPECLDPAIPDPIDEDCDQDGKTNLEEYAMGTDPTQSDFLATAVELSPASTAAVTLEGTAGRRYTLEIFDNPTWTALTSIYAAHNGMITLIDPGPWKTSAMYRVRIEIE